MLSASRFYQFSSNFSPTSYIHYVKRTIPQYNNWF